MRAAHVTNNWYNKHSKHAKFDVAVPLIERMHYGYKYTDYSGDMRMRACLSTCAYRGNFNPSSYEK